MAPGVSEEPEIDFVFLSKENNISHNARVLVFDWQRGLLVKDLILLILCLKDSPRPWFAVSAVYQSQKNDTFQTLEASAQTFKEVDYE